MMIKFCLSVCPSVRLSFCRCFSVSVCVRPPSVCMSVCICMCPCLFESACLSVGLPACLPACLCCLHVCLTVPVCVQVCGYVFVAFPKPDVSDICVHSANIVSRQSINKHTVTQVCSWEVSNEVSRLGEIMLHS